MAASGKVCPQFHLSLQAGCDATLRRMGRRYDTAHYLRAVEEIRRQMTYEQAQNVIVDCGTCKGWTLAQVADRRAASLRWYLKGYQGENNILRAAAAIIWDSLQEKQAG